MEATKVKETIKNVKELQSELGAQQGRLDFVKAEIDKLTRQRDALIEEVASVRSALTQDTERQRADIRAERNKLESDKSALEDQKSEVLSMAKSLKKERADFEDEKSIVQGKKESYDKLNERIGQFVIMVKRSAEGL